MYNSSLSKEPSSPAVPEPRKSKVYFSLGLLISCTFMSGNIFSLQGPFYPAEAEKKGLSSLEYGIVFGIYQISAIIFSPFLPYLIHKSSAYTVFQIAVFTIGSTTALFGFLDRVNTTTGFLFLSIVLRIFESIGSTAIFTTNSMFALGMFPESIATVFAVIETMYACGMAVGPAIGGAIYAVGTRINFAFTLPFLILGLLLLFLSILTGFALKNLKTSDTDSNLQNDGHIGVGYVKLVKVKKIAIYSLPSFGLGLSLGFITALLEPHLRQFGLSPGTVGLMFLIFGGTYTIGTLLWGYMLDHILSAKLKTEICTIIGCLLIFFSFLFLGPVSFMPISPSTGLTGVSLAILGIGKAGVTISTFSIMLRTGTSFSISQADILSYWNAVFGIGAFAGPIIGGWLLQSVGFQKATLLPLFLFLLTSFLILTTTFLEIRHRILSSRRLDKYENKDGIKRLYNFNSKHKKITNYHSI